MIDLYPISAIIIGVILGVVYYIYVKNRVKDKKWDILTNYVSIILSIVIGAMISIIIYNNQQKQAKVEKLNELRINLSAELSDINRVLNSNQVITVNDYNFLITYIEPIVIVECAKSGLFSPLEVENFLHISRKIKFYNVQVDYFLTLMTKTCDSTFITLISNCHTNIETSRLSIIQDINNIKKQLGLKLSESANFR